MTCQHKRRMRTYTATFALPVTGYFKDTRGHNEPEPTRKYFEHERDYDKQIRRMTKNQMIDLLCEAVENDGDFHYHCEKCDEDV